MRIAAHMSMAILACFVATAAVLLSVHGQNHLLLRPTALVLFLAGAAIGIGLVALVITLVLRRVVSGPFERLWWCSIFAVAIVALGLLAIVEISAL